MTTESIYTKVPTDLKEAVQNYASQNGKSLASAVSHLLAEGLNVIMRQSQSDMIVCMVVEGERIAGVYPWHRRDRAFEHAENIHGSVVALPVIEHF